MPCMRAYYRWFAVLLVAQVAFWWGTHAIRPATDIVPVPPGKAALHALSFGDPEFNFRLNAMHLQNFGDTFGRTISLRYYDYARLYQWFLLLDSLNARSDMMPSMATYYFSQTQNTSDVRYLINYLYLHSTRDVGKKWWWLMQSIYLSMYKANDMELALKVVRPMVSPAVPVWAQQMVAVVHEKRGEMEDALRIMETIRDNYSELSDRDLRYMRYFVEERIGKLEEFEKGGDMPALSATGQEKPRERRAPSE